MCHSRFVAFSAITTVYHWSISKYNACKVCLVFFFLVSLEECNSFHMVKNESGALTTISVPFFFFFLCGLVRCCRFFFFLVCYPMCRRFILIPLSSSSHFCSSEFFFFFYIMFSLARFFPLCVTWMLMIALNYIWRVPLVCHHVNTIVSIKTLQLVRLQQCSSIHRQ